MTKILKKTSEMGDKLRLWTCIKGNLLTILTVVGVVSGISIGLILKGSKETWTPREISYVRLLGDLFLSMLQGLILPLVISSLVAAVGSLDLSLSRKIGARGISFYILTTVLAVILGIILAAAIQPGVTATKDGDSAAPVNKKLEPSLTQDTLLDLLRTMFPPNLVQATLAHYKTKLLPPANATNETKLEDYTMKKTFEEGTNILGLVCFSIVLGIAVAKLQERSEQGKAVLHFFQGMSEVMMLITGWVIWFSPVGVAFLIAGEILRIDNFGKLLESMGLYLVTVITGITIHGFIVLPLLFFVFTRKLPWRFMGNMTQALVTAFSTGSSSATLPVTIKCVESNGVDPRVSRFLLPIGATINMDGTALYEAVAALFIAQLVGVEMNIGKIIAISLTATTASIGAAGIPHGGLVTLVMVLQVIGLPTHCISYIVPIDWLIDRFRTAMNVLGDAVAAGVVNHFSQEDLAHLSPLLPTTNTTTKRSTFSSQNHNGNDHDHGEIELDYRLELELDGHQNNLGGGGGRRVSRETTAQEQNRLLGNVC